jgi:GNAT superfamily N-acetyltransferase
MSIDTQNKVQFFMIHEVGGVREQNKIFESLNPQKRIEEYTSLRFAKMNNQIVGFFSLGFYKREAYLQDIKVVPSHRRKGVGTLIMLEIMREKKAQGHEFFSLHTKKPLNINQWPEEQTQKQFELEQQENKSNLQFFEKISSYGIKIEKTNISYLRDELIEIKYHLNTLESK